MNRRQAKLLRVAAAIPKVEVGNVHYNISCIFNLLNKSKELNVDIVVFPELCVTGYSCGDLFLQDSLMTAAQDGIESICKRMKSLDIVNQVVIVGAPYRSPQDGLVYNSAFVIYNGEVVGVVGKKNLPGYKEFYEPRWFSRDKSPYSVFEVGNDVKFGVEICEDVWAPYPPCTSMVQAGAEVIFNLSTSNELIGKHQYLMSMLRQRSADHICGYVYASSGFGESTQDLVYQGNAIIFENGKILAQNDRSSIVHDGELVVNDIDLGSLRNERATNTTFRQFQGELNQSSVSKWQISSLIPLMKEDDTVRVWNPKPFVPTGKELGERCRSILTMQSAALAKRLQHTGMKPVIGISGGSDSTWALIVSVEAMKLLGRPISDIIGVTMPGFATSERTRKNSIGLMKAFGIDSREISIVKMATEELKALGHDLDTQDVTYENVQARSRTQILMNLSNQEGGLVIGTGDLSELALGWCTYNADHMSMYGVNVSIPKTLIKTLIENYMDSPSTPAEVSVILLDILDTPVSPELTGSGAEGESAQVTEDKIGPYELHDFFLYNMLRHGYSPSKLFYAAEHVREGWSKEYTRDELKKWLRVFINRFFSQQFKRSCLPDGPKVGSISLSPRGDWRMPSDASKEVWASEINNYERD